MFSLKWNKWNEKIRSHLMSWHRNSEANLPFTTLMFRRSNLQLPLNMRPGWAPQHPRNRSGQTSCAPTANPIKVWLTSWWSTNVVSLKKAWRDYLQTYFFLIWTWLGYDFHIYVWFLNDLDLGYDFLWFCYDSGKSYMSQTSQIKKQGFDV